MKNLIKIFLLFLIPVIGVLLLSYPGVWKFRVESILNKKILKDSGWELSIGDLSGHLLGEIESMEIEIIHENGTQFYLPRIKTQFDILHSLTGKIHLKELNIFDFNYSQPFQKENSNVFVLPDLAYNKFPLEVDKLTFDGTLKVSLPDTNHFVDLNVLSAVHPNEYGLNINFDSLYVKHQQFVYSFRINDTQIKINNRIINLDPFNGSIADMLLDGRLTFIQDTNQRLNGTLNINNIEIPEKLFNNTPLDIKFSNINSSIRIDTDFKNYSGVVTLMNDLGLNMTGDFNISKMENRWLAQQVILESENARLFVHGDLIDNEIINANFILEELDLSKWLDNQTITNISGIADINSLVQDGIINTLELNLETEETALFDEDTIRVNGAFVYEEEIINISNPFSISVGPSSIVSKGLIDFQNEQLNIDLELSNADVFIINNFWNDSLESGLVSGDIKIKGGFKSPDIVGSIIGKNIKYKDFYLNEVELTGQREQAENYLGSTKLIIGSGNWRNIEFTSAKTDIDLYRNETLFKNIDIRNKNDYLIGSAQFDNKNNIYIKNVKTLFKEHYFVNTTPISLSFEENKFDLDYFSAHLDDGIIEGDISYADKLDGYLKFSNITSELINPIISNSRHQFKGLMFGEIGFRDSIENQNFDVDLSVKNGGFTMQPFDHMKAVMTYENNILNIDELIIQENETSKVTIKGSIPYGNKKKTDKIQLQFDLQETNYKTIAQFLPDWFDISATVNGKMIINGYGTNMLTDFAGTLKKGQFERIEFGDGAFRGSYDGTKLIFNSFSSDLGDIHFTGNGYLPIDLNLYSDTFGGFQKDDSLYIFVEGKSSNLDFITNYFDEVDDAPGNYTLALELTGIWDNIIRNGRLSASNATVYTPLLDDPIENMHGFVRIDNNQLIIDNLSGKMHKKSKRRSSKKDNVSLTGELDMTSFFDPYINVRATGKNAYFRSLIYEMEGLTDFDISISGQDTILFSGEVAPIDIEMFQSLTSNNLGALPSEEGSTIIHYKIDFPIRGKLSLINDLLDAVLVGDVSINQFGDEEANFAGELIIEEGKFYYYGDVFTIEEGRLTFDNRGFNPYLEISAFTTIDGEDIDISIIGKLDNPVLTFSSESGFSQSDILELLTWRKRFEEQEFSSTGIGYQASDRVLSWFGSQLDKNILKISGLDRLGLLENVDVRGTSGLITAEEDFSISAPLTENVAINYAYRRSFGITDSYHSLGVELRLNRNLSLVGNIDRSGYMHVKYRLRYSY